jgi:23S rRNA (uracil1939-C5)-methyltransferase
MRRPARNPGAAKHQRRQPSGAESSPLSLVNIAKPVYNGSFLAHVEGKAVFVPFVLPGEQARIRITQTKPGYSTAEAIEIVAASPHRVPPPCPCFGACGGCNYQHTGYENQLALKQAILRETLERAGVAAPEEIALLAAGPWAYRNRVRLAFDAGGRPGYRHRRSHDVIPIAACPIAAPLLITAALAAADILARVPPNLRPIELSLFCDPAESALLATFFVREPASIRLDSIARPLAERIPALQGADLATGGRPGHPAQTIARWGAPSILYPAAGFHYRVDNGAFFQVNRWLIDALVAHVTAGQHGRLAWDLFAGVGLFARALTSSFDRVLAVESAQASAAALEDNLRGTTGLAIPADTLSFLRGQHPDRPHPTGPGLMAPDLIVVDPPRTGLGVEIAALLGQVAAPSLLYVSCDPATLARDLRALIASGYAIRSVTLADLFPQTFHLETIVHLVR